MIFQYDLEPLLIQRILIGFKDILKSILLDLYIPLPYIYTTSLQQVYLYFSLFVMVYFFKV